MSVMLTSNPVENVCGIFEKLKKISQHNRNNANKS